MVTATTVTATAGDQTLTLDGNGQAGRTPTSECVQPPAFELSAPTDLDEPEVTFTVDDGATAFSMTVAHGLTLRALTREDSGPVAAGETFELWFDTDEPLAADPIARFTNGVDPPVAMDPIAPLDDEAWRFRGEAPLTGSATFYGVEITLVDDAGNEATRVPVTVEIDNVAPSLFGVDVSPAGAKVGENPTEAGELMVDIVAGL